MQCIFIPVWTTSVEMKYKYKIALVKMFVFLIWAVDGGESQLYVPATFIYRVEVRIIAE
jgi:hypothetical protein